jgi:3-oxoacid CoA-transferase
MITQKHFTLCESVEDTLKDYKPGSAVMVGGFGLSGIPENIIEYARQAEHVKDLTVISTEAGDDSWGLGRLIEKNKITKQYTCYIVRCKVIEKAYLSGAMELELIPQGTFAEKISYSAKGIPAFYCKVGLHTLYAEGKLPTRFKDWEPVSYSKKRETRDFNGETYLLEESFPTADFAWIKAWKADKMGNCIFKGTGYNFNRVMANAARCTIVEAGEIVKIGELKPEEIHLPALNLNRLFKGKKYEGRIEIAKFSDEEEENTSGEESSRDVIAKRAALDFEEGMSCNLGVGMSTLAASYAARFGRHVFMQSENGMIDVGGYPKKGDEDADWINAVSLRS